MSAHYVPHRSAASSLGQTWDYDSIAMRVDLKLTLGSQMFGFGVFVCSKDNLQFGRVPLIRIDNENWRLIAARAIRRWKWENGKELLELFPQPIAGFLNAGDTIVLTNTPSLVDQQFELL